MCNNNFDLTQLNVPALHTHSRYSDGIGMPEQNIQMALEKGLWGIATTEHGSCAALPVHNKTCHEYSINSILGTEFYLRLPDSWEMTDGSHISRNSKSGRYHMTCISKNWTGYEHLIALNNMAHQNMESKYGKKYPILTFDMMRDVLFNKDSGLVFLTGCASSPTYHDNMEMAEEYVNFLIKMVGIKDVYAEIMPHEFTRFGSDEVINTWERPLKLAKKMNLKTVWSNDAHAPRKEDLEYLRMLSLSKTGNEYVAGSIQSAKEMYDDAVKYIGEEDAQQSFINMHNLTQEIEQVEFHRPWALPDADVEVEEFKARIKVALEEDIKLNGDTLGKDVLRERYHQEYNLLEKYNFWAYYAIIADICQFANKNKIIYGVRGSANCSYLLYLDEITALHPVKFKLPFARFINTLRIKSDLPDADLDFADSMRDKVQDYAKERWGMQPVGTLMTYGHSSLVQELSRVYSAMHKGNLTIPDGTISRASAVDRYSNEAQTVESEEFKEWADYAEWIRPMYELLDGSISGYGTHACAVASTLNGIPVPIESWGSKSAIAYTESNTAKVLQDLGFAKIDILGLRTYSVIQEIVNDTDTMPPRVVEDNDPCFSIFNEKKIGGLFQFDTNVGSMMVDMLAGEINSIYTLSDMTSLGRPGPLSQGWHKDYANKTVKVDELSEIERTVTNWTRGIVIYQEQVGELLGRMIFGNYDHDAVEHGFYYMKTIVPKNKKMAESKEFQKDYTGIYEQFVDGGIKYYDMENDNSAELFDGLSGFIRYGFALPHSLGYANVSAQQAWQKFHYMAEFWKATLNSLGGNNKYQDKIIRYLVEAKISGLEYVPPHINKANVKGFQLSEDKTKLYSDISMVKGLGPTLVSDLMEALKDEPFRTLADVNERTKLHKTLKSILYHAGCFEGLTGTLYDLGVLEEKEFNVPGNWQDEVKSGILSRFANSSVVIDDVTYEITDEKLLKQCMREIKSVFTYEVLYRLDEDGKLIGFKRVKAIEIDTFSEEDKQDGIREALGFYIPDNLEELIKFAESKSNKRIGFVVDITEKETKYTRQRILHLHDNSRAWFVLEDKSKSKFFLKNTKHKSIIPTVEIGDLVGITLVMAKKDGETITYGQIERCVTK